MSEYTHIIRTTYKVQQIGIDMFTFDDVWRRIRGNSRNKMFHCHKCKKAFQDGDKISLLITNKGNKAACHNCANKLKEEMEG